MATVKQQSKVGRQAVTQSVCQSVVKIDHRGIAVIHWANNFNVVKNLV